MHLIVDGFRGNPEKLASEELVRGLLDRYPESVGMTKIAPPYVQRHVGGKSEDWGVSGFVLIAESHIAIHTFPERRHVWVDVFSCKGFDTEAAVRCVEEAFELGEAHTRILERGLEYPHVVSEAVPVAAEERTAVVAEVRRSAPATVSAGPSGGERRS
jgi:S-adenosylmethionine decarboxylase